MSSYEILNVPQNAPQQDIHTAYRKLAMAWHPDRHQGEQRAAANQYFQFLQEAYEKVKTPDNRHKYNQWLKTQSNAVLIQQNALVNDNKPLKSFLDTLETIFWPIDRNRQG